MAKLDTYEITPEDLLQLQGFQLDLGFLSSSTSSKEVSSASSPVAPSVVSSSPLPVETSPPTTVTTTVSEPTQPPIPEPMEISQSQITTPPTSPPISPLVALPPVSSPPVSSPTPVVVQPDPVKAKKMAQDILDRNLEYLWALQLLQHERVATIPSDSELKLASLFLDGVFALGTAVPPSMLTTQAAVRTAMDESGLVTGKRRHMRV